MIILPSAKVYSLPVSVSYPGQSLKCVKVTTLGPRTLPGSRLLITSLPGSALSPLVEWRGKPRDVNKRSQRLAW